MLLFKYIRNPVKKKIQAVRHFTRLRAYQIDKSGASFSLSVDDHLTLVEAVLSGDRLSNVKDELSLINRETIDTLHITSWDTDHCKYASLRRILYNLKPERIEYPSYEPTSEIAKDCKSLIDSYTRGEKIKITPAFVSLSIREKIKLRAQDLFYNPLVNGDNHNDNSLVKFFRIGTFTVLSLGDCESENISKALSSDDILTTEVDVLFLSHHGSENSVCTPDFLRKIAPKVAICCSNYDNQYEHPSPVIRQRLSSLNIPLFTTKTGDVIVQSVDKYKFEVLNCVSNNERLESVSFFENKTYYVAD